MISLSCVLHSLVSIFMIYIEQLTHSHTSVQFKVPISVYIRPLLLFSCLHSCPLGAMHEGDCDENDKAKCNTQNYTLTVL